MVLTGAVLWGLIISSRLKKRVEMLEAVEVFISAVSLEIEFISLPVYEILQKITASESCRTLDFIRICLDKMDEGENFKNAWLYSVDSSSLPFKAEESEKLRSLASLIGASDSEGQKAMLTLYLSYFSAFCDKARREYEKYGKSVITLSTVTGMAVLILIM